MELQGQRVAILVEDHYDDLELWYPMLRLRDAGAQVTVVGTGAGEYASRHGIVVQADTQAAHVRADDLEACVIPGALSGEMMAHHPALAELIATAVQQGKVVAVVSAIGQSPVTAQEPVDEGARQFFSLYAEMAQSDGPFKDSAVIRQGNLIMARAPVDLVAFCRMIIAALAERPEPGPGR